MRDRNIRKNPPRGLIRCLRCQRYARGCADSATCWECRDRLGLPADKFLDPSQPHFVGVAGPRTYRVASGGYGLA